MKPSASRRSRVYAPLLVAAVLIATIAAGGAAAGLRLNLSRSIPPGIYRVVRTELSRGAIVLVCLPSNIAEPAHRRGYIPSGSCSDGNAPIGKPIVAVAGDTVDVTSLGVFVNGRLLVNSRPLTHDSHGAQLERLSVARHVVSSDEFWLVSSHSARSFDSRYFGPVPRAAVQSRLSPVLTGRR